jgi:hypothetical protein
VATSNAIAVPGYLLFMQGTSLMAQSFDEDSATLSGDPFVVAQDVHFEEGNWRGVFDCSPDGTLIYQSAGAAHGSQLMWYSRDGRVLSKLGDSDLYNDLSLSHDGKRLAVSIGDPGGDLWIYDLARGVRTRYSFGSKVQRSPVWSPDDKQIASLENEQNTANLVVWSATSAGTQTPLYESPTVKRPTDYSPDGKYLMFSETPVGTGLYLLPFTGEKKPQEFREKRINANDGQFSPDGKWVVYSSQETGRTEIFVTQFPGPRGQWQVSNAGGSEPRWRKDGKAIYYWGADRNLTEAEVKAKDGRFEVNAIHPLFKVLMPVNPIAEPTYDVTADGKKFIVNAASSAADQPLTVVTNWTSRARK